jgi:hypothetical protein
LENDQKSFSIKVLNNFIISSPPFSFEAWKVIETSFSEEVCSSSCSERARDSVERAFFTIFTIQAKVQPASQRFHAATHMVVV